MPEVAEPVQSFERAERVEKMVSVPEVAKSVQSFERAERVGKMALGQPLGSGCE